MLKKLKTRKICEREKLKISTWRKFENMRYSDNVSGSDVKLNLNNQKINNNMLCKSNKSEMPYISEVS